MATKELSPLDLTIQALDISASERATFKHCRRQWELTVLENLEPIIPPTFELEFGGGIHRALETYYLNVANLPLQPNTEEAYAKPLKSALQTWDRWYAETDVKYGKADFDSDVKDAALDYLIELADLGEEMLRGYDTFSDEQDSFTIHAVEGLLTGAGKSWLNKNQKIREFMPEHSTLAVQYDPRARRLLVPIIDPNTNLWAEGHPVFSCRIDLLVHRIDIGANGLWVYDHKTCAAIPGERGMDFDDQITGYLYSVWRWLGIIPRGFCFNYLAKQAPKDPRILKDGSLSTAKNQLTSAELYREELERRGLILKDGTVVSEKHAEAYAALLSYGWDRFFARHYVTRNRQELMSFERRLFEEWEDMSDCAAGDLPLYPNLSRFHCGRCQVNQICQGIEEGSDWKDIINTRFMEKADRKASIDLADER